LIVIPYFIPPYFFYCLFSNLRYNALSLPMHLSPILLFLATLLSSHLQVATSMIPMVSIPILKIVSNTLPSVEFRKVSTPNAILKSESPGIPITLTIPALNLTAPILPEGLTYEQKVAVPDETVGWYTLSARPGQLGSVALAGHYRNPRGKPGIFFNLDKLQPGSEVLLQNEAQQSYHYLVDQVELVTIADFPLTKVYNRQDAPWLSLVTCAGKYDPRTKDYDQRLIISAKLKK
jgi:LPXTG-site transpeptidase (sortase) family protein